MRNFRKPRRSEYVTRAAVETLEERRLLASIQLAAELPSDWMSNNIEEIVELKGTLYVDSWTELFASGGTQASTSRVFDFGNGTTNELVATDSRLFMRVSASGFPSNQLWTSDGTAAGTRNITPAGLTADSGYHAAFGSRLFFAGTTGTSSATPWISDGTTSGTAQLVNAPLVTNIDPVEMNGELFFIAGTSINGYSVYRTDGTSAGTQAIYSIPTLFADDMAAAGDVLFLSLPSQQWALTRDGSANQISNLFDASDLMTWNDVVYFGGSRGGTGSEGWEPWRSDGTAAGTYILKDIYPGSNSSNPRLFVGGETHLAFLASTSATGYEWCFTDGTPAGTFMGPEVKPGLSGVNSSSVSLRGYAMVADTVYYSDLVTDFGSELCQADGTPEGTRMVEDLKGIAGDNVGSWPDTIRSFGPVLYFAAADDLRTDELFKYAPTDEGRLSGDVYADDNHNGARDAGEAAIPDITLYADTNGNSLPDAGEARVVSAADGSYEFDVPAGVIVRAVLPAGMGQSAPSPTGPGGYVLAAGELRGGSYGLYVNTPPTVTLPPFTISEGQIKAMSAQVSDAESPIARYEWDLNYDGSFNASETGATPNFDAANIDGPASRDIALRVYDYAGGTATAYGTIQVANATPTASFTLPGFLARGSALTVQLMNPWDAAAADRSSLRYSYDFGNDGTIEISSATSPSAQVPAARLATAGTLSIRAIVTDDDGGSSSYLASVKICDFAISATTIADKLPAESVVASLSVIGTSPIGFTYSLVSGEGSADNAAFRIDANQLRLLQSANLATKSSYAVRIRCGGNGMSIVRAFTLNVIDTNLAPTAISLSASTIAEGRPVGSLVGTLSGADPDADGLTYSLVSGTGSADNARFQVVSGQLRSNEVFDYETKKTYAVRLRATDSGGLFVEKAFTIRVTDAAETPLVVDGTAGRDNISLAIVGSKLRTTRNGVVLSERELSLIGDITINGLGDNDRITIAAQLQRPVFIYGGDGNDTITGGGGNDTIYGNFGDDLIVGGAGNDSIMAGIGADSVSGVAGDDSIWGGDHCDTILGGDGNDYIEGKGKADSLYGDAGNDTLLGQAGSDLVYGGLGDDSIYVADPAGVTFSDTVRAGAGTDSVSFDPLDFIFEKEIDLLA